MKKILLFLALFLLPLSANASTAVVQAVIDQGIAAASSGANAATFSQIFRSNFAVDTIADRTLGAAGRSMSPDQKAQFRSLFAEYIVYTQLSNFRKYGGEQIIITGESGGYVNSKLVNGSELPISWRVEGGKITDVVVNGVSMMQVYRADFNSVARRSGPDGLLASMQSKINSFR